MDFHHRVSDAYSSFRRYAKIQIQMARLLNLLGQSSKINRPTGSQKEHLLRISKAWRMMGLVFMETHPQLAAKAIELGHSLAVTDRGGCRKS